MFMGAQIIRRASNLQLWNEVFCLNQITARYWLMFPEIPDEWIIKFERSHSVLHGLANVRTGTR